MKIDDLTVTVKVNDEAFEKAVNKLNEKIQEIKNIKNEMCIILNDLDKMLDGKLLSAKINDKEIIGVCPACEAYIYNTDIDNDEGKDKYTCSVCTAISHISELSKNNFENRIKDEGQTQLHECECINIPENKENKT